MTHTFSLFTFSKSILIFASKTFAACLSARTSPGIEIDAEEIISKIVSDSTTGSSDEQAPEKIVIPTPIPPTPFDVFKLRVGESATVNDFEIKVLSIDFSSAVFIVKKKASSFTFTYKISKGWNLYSMPGEIEAERNNCNSSEWSLFEYVKETNSFRKVKNPVPGKAYWLYNPGKSCEAKVFIRDVITLNELGNVTRAWNFVAVVPEMIGKNINDLGSCNLRAAYRFNAKNQQWEGIMRTTIDRSDIGKGFAIYSNNNCTLGELSFGRPSIPALPEVPERVEEQVVEGSSEASKVNATSTEEK